MDFATLMIVIFILSITFVPMLCHTIIRSRAKRKNLAFINSLLEHGTEFHDWDLHFKKIFAVDPQNKGFVFADLTNKDQAVYIDLNKYKSCKLLEINKGGSEEITIIFSDGQGSDRKINLFSAATEPNGIRYWDDNEMIARKWFKKLKILMRF